MPTYNYRCGMCGAEKETVHKITEEPMIECPSCGERMHRVPVKNDGGVVYNGTWFQTKGKY